MKGIYICLGYICCKSVTITFYAFSYIKSVMRRRQEVVDFFFLKEDRSNVLYVNLLIRFIEGNGQAAYK